MHYHPAFCDKPRPVDSTARHRRKPRAIGSLKGRKQHLRRFAALALAVAVPAFAAPSEWQGFTLVHATEPQAAAPMGYEIPGESFPGSAFYYLAEDPSLTQPSTDPAATDTFDPSGNASSGPAAHALAIGGSALDKARALRCMTQAIYYEAATESDAGQRAVAQVVLNRVAHPAFPDNVCGVVFEGSERSTGCQFSFTCDGSLARQPSQRFWDRAQKVALAALNGAVYAPVGLATHYHTLQVHPYWDASMADVTTIGAHRFLRWRGPAGLAAAFTAAYIGHEPLPAPHPRSKASEAPVPDPIELERAYEASLAAVQPATVIAQRNRASGSMIAGYASPAPSYSAAIEARGGDAQFTASRLPGAGEVRQEYSASGQWLSHP